VPHWCDPPFLAALIGADAREAEWLFDRLRSLTVVEPFPARGERAVNVHESARLPLREHLRTTEPDRWRTLAEAARRHVTASQSVHARIEALFHLFAIDQPAAAAEFEILLQEFSQNPEWAQALVLAMRELAVATTTNTQQPPTLFKSPLTTQTVSNSQIVMNRFSPENNLIIPSKSARIEVIGVGGGGSNAVNCMVSSYLEGLTYRVLNTDAQALLQSRARHRMQLGQKLTRGLSAGGNPVIGKMAAEESRAQLQQSLEGADLVCIVAGMGGGTGTGAAPILAQVAKECGALTIGMVTRPFNFEGRKRLRQADEGIARLAENVDTLIVIPNDRLRDADGIGGAPLQEVFRTADDVLRMCVKGISDIITKPGLVNVDFADVRSVMADAGTALLGIGVGSGRSRSSEAASAAMSSPLLESARIDGARGCVINISGGRDMTLEDMTTASEVIYEVVDPDANIIIGAVVDENLEGEIHVTVIATGFEGGIRFWPKRSESVFSKALMRHHKDLDANMPH
jgi:cell division protein FtsZ